MTDNTKNAKEVNKWNIRGHFLAGVRYPHRLGPYLWHTRLPITRRIISVALWDIVRRLNPKLRLYSTTHIYQVVRFISTALVWMLHGHDIRHPLRQWYYGRRYTYRMLRYGLLRTALEMRRRGYHLEGMDEATEREITEAFWGQQDLLE